MTPREAHAAAGRKKRASRARCSAPGPVKITTGSAITAIVEESRLLPLVDIQITLRTGSVHDPRGKEGLSRICAAMIRMGTRRMPARVVEETIDRLGGHLSIQCASSFTHFSAVVLERNLDPFMALLGELLRAPAWRAGDLELVKRETVAEIIEACDDDHALSARHFRRYAFGAHPYGRPVSGTPSSVRSIERGDAIRHWSRHFVKPNLIVGASGAISAERLGRLVDEHLGGVADGKAPRDRVPATRIMPGRRVLVVDKPERTQTQILIGTLGARAGDPDYFALAVGNTVFGGTFTSRLMREIRSKRGWSYGASSRIAQDRQRDLWWMWAFPAARDAVPCIRLELSLLEKLLDRGISENELRFAKRFLTKSHAFDIDTPVKRLMQSIDVELFGLPRDFYLRFVERIQSVTRSEANEALARRLSAKDLAIVLVATADQLKDQLADLPGVKRVDTVAFDAE